MKSIHLYGASGHAKVIADILEAKGRPISGVYDDDLEKPHFRGLEIKRTLDRESEWILSIGSNAIRKRLHEELQLSYTTAIHPSSQLSPTVQISPGTVVMAGVAINADTFVGQHAILNTACRVDHDCYIADFVHISPGATLCGGVSVGEGTHIGAGAVVIPGIRIGANCVIGAGTVVTRDIPDGTKAVGNPARIL